MPLPHIPDGYEKPPTLAGEPGAPAVASPQSELLAELWRKALELKGIDTSGLGPDARRTVGGRLYATQDAVTAVLVHLYGQTPTEAQGHVQRALAAGQEDAQALL